jgi:hypothetical protein
MMELSPARQKLLFVVIVVVLAVLGYVLVLPSLQHKNGPTASPPKAAPSSAAPVTPVATLAPAATQSAAGGAVNIYDWLPFTEQDLTAAAATATQFSVESDTYTYTESPATYMSKLNGLVTSELAAQLENAYTTPGTAGLRTGQKQISSATATIYQLRAFGSQSLTFLVTINERIVSDKGTSNGSNNFAVTLTGSGSNWQVYDIEPASAGNT